jgi:hypothetical protein
VGVIDWEWAQTVSRGRGFLSPLYVVASGQVYKGSNELAEDEMRLAAIFREKGHKDSYQPRHKQMEGTEGFLCTETCKLVS